MTYRLRVIGYTAPIMRAKNVATIEANPEFALNLEIIAAEPIPDYSLPEVLKVAESNNSSSFAAEYFNLDFSNEHVSEQFLANASKN